MAPPSTTRASSFVGVDIPSDDVITNCMHCGLCLPTCPTYVITGLEKSSPRGRIRLIKAVADGTLPISPGFVEEMNFCLDCQACETACPAGVRYGSLVESARAQIFVQEAEKRWPRWLKKFFLGWVFSRHERLKIVAILLRWYQRSGVAWFLDRSGLLRLVSARLAKLQGLAPVISAHFSSESLREVIPAIGERRFRVGMLTGCIMDVAYADVNAATIELLRKHGCEVWTPRGQSCCGSLTAHNGDMESARHMAERILSQFAAGEWDLIVMNSAGCGAFLKEYVHLFPGEQEKKASAARISAHTLDLTEFLALYGFHPTSVPMRKGIDRPLRVTYHDACHLAHSQKVTVQPRQLLKQISGIEYLELPEASWCCGSAGIYNIARYEDAVQFLNLKLDNIKAISPDIVVTGNPGCMLQVQHGLAEHGLKVEVVHTASFLNEACAR